MPTLRRFAAPALAVLVALGASGCAGLNFNTGCGMGVINDPMADGASRLNRATFQRAQLVSTHQAYQKKALMVSTEFNRGAYRKPGQTPIAPSNNLSSGLCFR
jgi:hypothetical protein